MKNPKLENAVAVFKELGWEGVTAAGLPDLPLGTAKQRQAALAGLKSGDWGEHARLSENRYGWRSYIDVESRELALFAVSVGVDARRAVNISYNADKEMLTRVIARRGEKYAADFIACACVSRRRGFEHSASVFGNVAVRLVDALNLDIPQSVEYMKDWSVYAAMALGLKAEVSFREGTLPLPELIEKRFVGHIVMGVAVNTPATGPFGAVLPAGVARGWLDRDQAVTLVFSALDAAVRPGDRKVWLDVLDQLGVSDEELCDRTEALIPLVASGDSAVMMRLAPRLIARAGDSLLTELLLASFSAATKKARLLILKSALERPCPADAQTLAPWLAMLANDQDKGIALAAEQLAARWKLSVEAIPEDKYEVQGLWQLPPPVWQVPSLDLGTVSPEALTELAAELVNRPAVIHDVVTEKFLAMLNAVAYRDPEAARTSLQGLRRNQSLPVYIINWVKEETPTYGFDEEGKKPHSLLRARDYVVSLNFGKLPCLLSTPGRVDLSIHVAELTERLIEYQKAGSHVLEADLLLALTRLDVSTGTPETEAALSTLDLPVVLQSGAEMVVTAGPAVLGYLKQPFGEPVLEMNKYRYWSHSKISLPESLRAFPNRFTNYLSELYSVFPLWGDAALGAVRWSSEVYHERGLELRQVVRRASPLPPGAAINLLAAQRSMVSDAAEDSARAVTEAWERGLLRPGIADSRLLDWSSSPPSNLAAFAQACDGIIQDGLLAIVWPLLDELVEASLKAPRLIAGTAEIAGLISGYLPEVQLAVEQGRAEPSALYLPGIRALAGHGGNSRAVATARGIAGLLPPAPAVWAKEAVSRPVMEPPFYDIWPVTERSLPLIDDGVDITVDWVDPEAKTRLFLFTLTLPDQTDRVFQVVNRGWYYDMEREGQCSAYAVPTGTTTFAGTKDNRVWLHWDEQQKAIVVCNERNWAGGNDGPLRSAEIPPLPSSLLTVIIGVLAQDGDAVYYAPRLLRRFIDNGEIGEEMVERAMKVLLGNPVVSPGKLVRALEKDIRLLYVLWPMLTESVKHAGTLAAEGQAPPVWINRILDIALRYAPYLAEAAAQGLMPENTGRWPGLAELASLKSKSAAIAKAKKLQLILTGVK